MSRRVASVLPAMLLLLLAVITSAARATPSDRFSANIAPDAVQPLAGGNYALAITNAGSSPDAADNAHIVVPDGFTVDGTSLSASTSAHGSCSAATWGVALDQLMSTIDATAPLNPESALCPGATLTVTFVASSPGVEAAYFWTTTLFTGASPFTLQGGQPRVSVDGTAPPPPDLASTPPDPSNSSAATFAFSDDDPEATFVCQLDGGSFAACPSPSTYTGLGEGAHTFAAKAVDPAGNVSTETSYAWTIDLTPPPPPTITSGPPSVTAATNATFSFTDDDSGAAFRCKLDGGSFSNCTSPITYSDLEEGAHTFAVKAVDPAGNQSTVASYVWTIDLSPPPPPTITSAPPSESGSTSATFAFTDADASATFRCRLDGDAFSSCTSTITYSDLEAGSHTFRVRARDAAGNDSAPTSYTWTIDLTPPPPPTITSAPPNVAASTTATFSFTDADHTAAFHCKLDGGSYATCTSPVTYGGLAEGGHTFSVKAVDPAGNQSTATSYAWTIDVTPPPPPTITSAPPNVTASTTATFSFTDADGSAAFRCRLDGGNFSACASPITYTDLAEGDHTFRVKALDPAGNESEVTSYDWFIDLTNPVVTIDPASEPHDPTNQTGASFVFTSNKAGSTFECRLDAGEFSPCTSPKAYSGLADGRRNFGVRATDSLGNVGLATVYEWTIDTVPPATTITSEPAGVTSSHSATFGFTSGEASSSFACSLDGGAFGPCVPPKTYAGLADGHHAFQVRATDAVGNTDPTPASYSWQVVTPVVPDTTPPGTVLGLTRRVGYGLLRLAWSAPTDPDFDHVEVVRSRGTKGAARTVVYEGSAAGYTEKRFRNGTYFRYEIRSYDHAGNISPVVGVVVPPSALLRSPRNGAAVRVPPLLLWARVPRASYYNVQVYRGSRKVLSAWPAKAKLKMRRSWVYQGHRFPFRKGVYHWWVWPAFGPRSKAAYGQLLGTGTFVVR